MNKLEKIAVSLLLVVLVALTVAYVYGVGTQWEEMTARPVRVSYFMSDLTILFPLAIATIIGLGKNREWGRRLFLLTLGALLFDTAHQVYYLFWDNYFGVPWIVAALLLAVIVGYAVFGYYAVTARQHEE